MDNSGQYSRLRPGIRIFCILPKQGRKENAEETKEGEGIWRKLVPEKGQREQGSGQCREDEKVSHFQNFLQIIFLRQVITLMCRILI